MDPVIRMFVAIGNKFHAVRGQMSAGARRERRRRDLRVNAVGPNRRRRDPLLERRSARTPPTGPSSRRSWSEPPSRGPPSGTALGEIAADGTFESTQLVRTAVDGTPFWNGARRGRRRRDLRVDAVGQNCRRGDPRLEGGSARSPPRGPSSERSGSEPPSRGPPSGTALGEIAADGTCEGTQLVRAAVDGTPFWNGARRDRRRRDLRVDAVGQDRRRGDPRLEGRSARSPPTGPSSQRSWSEPPSRGPPPGRGLGENAAAGTFESTQLVRTAIEGTPAWKSARRDRRRRDLRVNEVGQNRRRRDPVLERRSARSPPTGPSSQRSWSEPPSRGPPPGTALGENAADETFESTQLVRTTVDGTPFWKGTRRDRRRRRLRRAPILAGVPSTASGVRAPSAQAPSARISVRVDRGGRPVDGVWRPRAERAGPVGTDFGEGRSGRGSRRRRLASARRARRPRRHGFRRGSIGAGVPSTASGVCAPSAQAPSARISARVDRGGGPVDGVWRPRAERAGPVGTDLGEGRSGRGPPRRRLARADRAQLPRRHGLWRTSNLLGVLSMASGAPGSTTAGGGHQPRRAPPRDHRVRKRSSAWRRRRRG